MRDDAMEIVDNLIGLNDPSAAYTCTSAFFQYEIKRGSGIEIFVVNDCAYSLVKIEKYIDQELGWLYSNKYFNFRIRSARLLGSQVLSLDKPNLKLVEMSKEIFEKTNVSVIVLPAIRMSNFKYNLEDFDKKNMSFFLLGGWQACITIAVPESLENYSEKLGKKKRYNLNRQSKKIAELLGSALMVREFYLEDHVPELIRQMMVLGKLCISPRHAA